MNDAPRNIDPPKSTEYRCHRVSFCRSGRSSTLFTGPYGGLSHASLALLLLVDQCRRHKTSTYFFPREIPGE